MERFSMNVIQPDQQETRVESCAQHGKFESKAVYGPMGKIVMWTKCSQCKQIDKENQVQKELDEARQAKTDRLHAKLKRAGIPARFLDKSFSDYKITNEKQARQVAKCQKYAERFELVLKNGISLLMIGNSGTGKNHLAMAIANSIIKRGYTTHYDDVYMMLSDIKHAQKSSEEKETDAIRALSVPDLLIIDEVGDQVGSESDKRLLNKIVNQRYADNKPIILISNKDEEEVKKVLGTRIINRLRENSGRIILFDWKGHRGNIKCDEIWQ